MKSLRHYNVESFCGRPPRRGAWIEILRERLRCTWRGGRPPRRGAWIEIPRILTTTPPAICRPPHRGAWIEIPVLYPSFAVVRVAPRTGGRGLK